MLPFRHLVSSEQLTKDSLQHLFYVADMMGHIASTNGRTDILEDKIIALLFFEPSSRTMLSFQSAAQRLKAGIIFAQSSHTTSFQKGESLEDMIRVTASYSDVIVMRHHQAGSAQIAADISSVPFINAGDGDNEHPTQALTDTYTILKELGRLDNLRITFGFDPLQSRSIHSLARVLSLYDNNHFIFTGPPALRPSESFLSSLQDSGISCAVTEQLDEALDTDILYLNRLQEERFPDHALFKQLRRAYSLTKAMAATRDFIILDPLPRIDEISTEVDSLPRAAYFRQAAYGVPIRMALLASMLQRA